MAALWPFVLAAASGILAIDTPHSSSLALHHLTKQLLQTYRKEVRPVHNWTQATTVYLDVSVHAVLDVVWDDEFLSWNSSMFDEIREISLPLSAIWAPDIIINEYVDIERSPDLPYVYVNSSGTIKHSKPIQVVSACSLETYAFPFDVQNCSLTFSSILHTVEDVDLAFLRSTEDITHDQKAFLNDSEWELLSVSSTYRILQNSAGDFAQIQFNVVIRRHPLVYVVSLLIPSIFLMLVDLGSFYLPPTCQARILFKTSVLVGYTVFRVNMSDEVPRSAGSTPLIESSVCQEYQAPSGTLMEVWSQLRSIGSYFQTQDQVDRQELGWLALLQRFDRLLFQSYLVVLGLYAVTLSSLWVSWSG
ncbi:hypothetical protein MJT46_009936 [Ovis ammon polii x Ovis aries]|nr:hypothetical protein MJT46_009936 [Ovis ammon polii x Ovis aries]